VVFAFTVCIVVQLPELGHLDFVLPCIQPVVTHPVLRISMPYGMPPVRELAFYEVACICECGHCYLPTTTSILFWE